MSELAACSSWEALSAAAQALTSRKRAHEDGDEPRGDVTKRPRFDLDMGGSDNDSDSGDADDEKTMVVEDGQDAALSPARVAPLYDVRVCVDASVFRVVLARAWVFSQKEFPAFAELVETCADRCGFARNSQLPATNVLSRALVTIFDRPGLVHSVSWYLSMEDKERLVDVVAHTLRSFSAPVAVPPSVLAVFNGSGVPVGILRDTAAGMVASICNLAGLSLLHVPASGDAKVAHRNRVFVYGVLAVSRLARQVGANLSMESGWQALFADFVAQRELFLPVCDLADLQQGIDEHLRERASLDLDTMYKMLKPAFETIASAMRSLLSGQSGEQAFSNDALALELWQATAKIAALLSSPQRATSRVEHMALCSLIERRASDVEFALFISGQLATLRRVAAFRAANPDARWYTVPSASVLAMTHVLSECGFDASSDSKSLCAAWKLFVSDYSYDDVGACTVQTLNIFTTPFFIRLIGFYTCCLARMRVSATGRFGDALPGPAYVDLVDMLLDLPAGSAKDDDDDDDGDGGKGFDTPATFFNKPRFQHILRAFAWWLGYVLVDTSTTALHVELAHKALKGKPRMLAYVVGMLFAAGSRGVEMAATAEEFARFGNACALGENAKGTHPVSSAVLHDYLQRICKSPSDHPMKNLLNVQISGRIKRVIGDSARWLASQKAVGGFPTVTIENKRRRLRDEWLELAQVFHLCDGIMNGMDMSTVAARSTMHVEDIAKLSEVFHTTTPAGSFGWKQRIWMPRSDFSSPILSDDFRPFFARLRRVWKD